MTRRYVLRQVAAVGGLLAPLVLVLTPTASAAVPRADAGSGTATVSAATDAWYSASSACTASPTGCLPAAAPVSPYPAKTLHIGAAGGQEESRSYLTLNLTALPAGTSVTGGSLRLPLGGSEEGSVSPDAATLVACVATGSFKDDVDGSTASPPGIDCKRATSPAKYVAAAGNTPAMLTVDLAPLATAWTSGAPTQGIALVPAADAAAGSTWHVALSAHDREVAAPQRISATVTYGSAAGDFEAPATFGDAIPPASTGDLGTGSASFAAPPLAPVATTQVPAAIGPAVPVIAPQTPLVAPAQQLQPLAAVTVGGFAYPAVFLLPLLLAVVCGYLGRSLTRDLTPAAV